MASCVEWGTLKVCNIRRLDGLGFWYVLVSLRRISSNISPFRFPNLIELLESSILLNSSSVGFIHREMEIFQTLD